jgi:hypothetical protein
VRRTVAHPVFWHAFAENNGALHHIASVAYF